MLNQYTTLVLNLPGLGSTFGNDDFTPLVLPTELALFYDLLFPRNSSNYHKQFLMYGFLRLVEAAGSTATLKQDDARITYDLNAVADFFRTNRVVRHGGGAFDMLVYGTLKKDETTSYYFDSFDVSQLGFTPRLLVYSQVTKNYLKGPSSSPNPDDCAIDITLDAEGRLTKPISIGSSGLSFCLSGDFTTFNDTSKSWTVRAESPFKFDFPALMKNIDANSGIVDRMLNYGGDSSTGHELVYQRYFNTVYRFAALLHCYYNKVNTLWQRS